MIEGIAGKVGLGGIFVAGFRLAGHNPPAQQPKHTKFRRPSHAIRGIYRPR